MTHNRIVLTAAGLLVMIILSGCAAIVPGNTGYTVSGDPLPEDAYFCVTPNNDTPVFAVANKVLIASLSEAGIPLGCGEGSLQAIWDVDIGDARTETLSTPGYQDTMTTGSMACAGGTCAGSSVTTSTSVPGNTISSTSYGRDFFLVIPDPKSTEENPSAYWGIQLQSRGEITDLKRLMGIWAPLVARNFLGTLEGEFFPNSGLNLLLD